MGSDTFVIREAVAEDVPALAQLHVDSFIETHGGRGPTYALRESQWQEAFAQTSPDWFCFVILAMDGALVGFAKGIPYVGTGELACYAGELNKIYLLRKFQRRGLGRRLVGHVCRRFLANGIHSMLLFGDAHNPSNGFYEALGATRLYSPEGAFHGGYGWRDLQALADRCPLE
jgi:ribosomal protein S18 acetylase RimI-like enzyme